MNVIDDVLTSFTLRPSSHRSSWPRMQRCLLEDYSVEVEMSGGDLEKLEQADKWYVSHGMEFKDAYNLNSGWLPEHAARLRIMIEKGSEGIISLERKMPNLRQLLEPRASKTEFNLSESEWSALERICNQANVLTHLELWNQRRVVLGDSHSVGRYRGGSLVLRNDGLTLHGLLSRGIRNILEESGVNQAQTLVIQSGNIDIRHHLMRQGNPKENLGSMLGELWLQLVELAEEGIILDYEVTQPYPIEFEGRKLPKTGYYKGTPFFGSISERQELVHEMTSEMKIRFPKVHMWPQEWYELDPELYAERFMEKPRSVHLSPEYHEWNYDRNEARYVR